MSNARRIITPHEDSIDIDASIRNKWNWSWLEKKITVDVKTVALSTTWKGDFNFILCWRIYRKGINQIPYRDI